MRNTHYLLCVPREQGRQVGRNVERHANLWQQQKWSMKSTKNPFSKESHTVQTNLDDTTGKRQGDHLVVAVCLLLEPVYVQDLRS
jgi:hypothetical protein